MNFSALIAMMVALAAPNAHGPTTVKCQGLLPWNFGLAIPEESKIVLDYESCAMVSSVARHHACEPQPDPHPSARRKTRRKVRPVCRLDFLSIRQGLHVLLHEAAHIGQYREQQPPDERDAECRALSGLRLAMSKLRYSETAWQRMDTRMRSEIASTKTSINYRTTCPYPLWLPRLHWASK